MSRPTPGKRADYRYFTTLDTRWHDNDIYGHVNNTLYYSFFDTVIARYLMTEGGLDPWRHQVVGLAVETGCRFFSSLAFPDTIHGGLRIDHLGTTSVRYGIGIFKSEADQAAAEGHFIHVFVDRPTNRPVPIPDPVRMALARLT